MDDVFKVIGFVLGGTLLVIGLFFLLPWISFWFCYFCGWCASIVIGKYIVAGLGILGINITVEQIPLIAGVLGWIGGFFKTISSTKNKKEEK